MDGTIPIWTQSDAGRGFACQESADSKEWVPHGKQHHEGLLCICRHALVLSFALALGSIGTGRMLVGFVLVL